MDLVTFSAEIINGKLHFLRSRTYATAPTCKLLWVVIHLPPTARLDKISLLVGNKPCLVFNVSWNSSEYNSTKNKNCSVIFEIFLSKGHMKIKRPEVHFIIKNISFYHKKYFWPIQCLTFIFYQNYFYDKMDLRDFRPVISFFPSL